MKSSIKLKIAALGLALGVGMANTAAVANTSCSSSCHSIAMQQTTTYCASVGGGSACGSIYSGVYRHFYSQCLKSC